MIRNSEQKVHLNMTRLQVSQQSHVEDDVFACTLLSLRRSLNGFHMHSFYSATRIYRLSGSNGVRRQPLTL